MIVCLFNELVDDISVGVQERDYVIDVFPNEHLYLGFAILAMKMFEKATDLLVPMAVPCICK